MIMAPNNPNKIFVNMWQHRRYPWFFESGGESSGLYVTHDGGDNWKKLNAEDMGRASVNYSPMKAYIPTITHVVYQSQRPFPLDQWK
ncbi:hypothetical protein [Algoriphagus alkaliphilus]|nr:hypothetical protein [Algoriphagus alkaliphilus]